jgi:hypothetical protein
VVAAEAASMPRQRGLILVLVVDDSQMASEHETIARVCRDYDVSDAEVLAGELALAAAQAANQVRLYSAARDLVERRRGRVNDVHAQPSQSS